MSSDWVKYVPWFRLAQAILGDSVPRVSDDDVVKWVSKLDWAIVPFGSEKSAEEAKNRPFPNIYLRIEGDEMTVGLICNTQKSIDRMRNILTGFHNLEKTRFLTCLSGLDDSFQTGVSTKIKEFNPRQSPEMRRDPRKRSNQVSERDFAGMFIRADVIREEGLTRRRKEGKTWSPESPSLTLARSSFSVNREAFGRKLEQLRPLYEISLRINSDAQIKRASQTGKSRSSPVYACPKCDYVDKERSTKFCPNDGSFLILTTETKE